MLIQVIGRDDGCEVTLKRTMSTPVVVTLDSERAEVECLLSELSAGRVSAGHFVVSDRIIPSEESFRQIFEAFCEVSEFADTHTAAVAAVVMVEGSKIARRNALQAMQRGQRSFSVDVSSIEQTVERTIASGA